MSCECFQVGGKFIAEDPDCEIHGTDAQNVPVVRNLTNPIIEELWLKAKLDLMAQFYKSDTGPDLDTRNSYRQFARLVERYIKGEDV